MEGEKQMEGENSEVDDRDKVKLSQKTSSISLHIFKNDYYIKTKIKIPEDYPETQISRFVCKSGNLLIASHAKNSFEELHVPKTFL